MGGEGRFFVRITNNQNLEDRNLRIQFALPQGIDITALQRDANPVAVVNNGNGIWTIREPIRFIRAGEALSFFLVVTPRVAPRSTIGRRRRLRRPTHASRTNANVRDQSSSQIESLHCGFV